jgi:hypothetical protein
MQEVCLAEWKTTVEVFDGRLGTVSHKERSNMGERAGLVCQIFAGRE